MVGRMGFSPAAVDERLERAGRTKEPWVEYAHTPHLPHVGTARVLLTAASVAASTGGTLILCMNDQLPPRDLVEARRLPIIRQSSEVSGSPTLALSKTDQKKALCFLPPPSDECLNAFECRWLQIDPNRRHEIRNIVEALRATAATVSDLAAWFARLMCDLLGVEPVVIPTSEILKVLDPGFGNILDDNDLTWGHCCKCGYRLGRVHEAAGPCPTCGKSELVLKVPDVKGRQVILNIAEPSSRICGREKPYQSIANSKTTEIFGCGAPPRLRVSGAVRVALKPGGQVEDRVNLLDALASGIVMDRVLGECSPQDNVTLSPNGGQTSECVQK